MLSLLLTTLACADSPTSGQLNRYRAAPANSLLSIVPLDGAEFLLGQYFDISIELHNVGSTESPSVEGIQATVDGAPMEQFLKSNFSAPDTWDFEYFEDVARRERKEAIKVGVSRVALRNIYIDKPGIYQVQVTIGNQKVSAQWTVRKSNERMVKNLVLFIGDGMASGMISAARYLTKKTNFGKFGTNVLEMEKLGSIGKIITNGVDSIITDSANSAAAFTTGHKTWNSALNVYVDTNTDPFDDAKVETISEYIRRHRRDMCIGVVTSAEVTDATPASMFAHTRERGESQQIVDQMINGPTGNLSWTPPPVKADVFFGGGGKSFCQTIVNGSVSRSCSTLGNKDYYAEYEKEGYTVVKDKTQLEAYNGDGPVLGIFALSHMVLLVHVGCMVGSKYLH
jgi:alkaline phosphatase